MVDKVKDSSVEQPTVNTDGACEDARKDADKIREVFSTQGIQEAYATLLKEREGAKLLGTAAERDTWEKEMVMALSGRQGKQDILPALSLAFLNENKEAFKNPDEAKEFDVREVRYQAGRMFDKLDMETAYGNKENKVDDLQVALLGNAADVLNKNDYNGENILEFDDLSEVLTDNAENAKTEGEYQKTRDTNKQIAEAFAKSPRLFGVLDEAEDGDVDGKISEEEVDTFLEHCKKNESFKQLFTKEELKAVEDLKATFDDANNIKDDNNTLVKTSSFLGTGWFRDKWITQESIAEAVGGVEAMKAIGSAITGAGKALAEAAVKALEEAKGKKDSTEKKEGAEEDEGAKEVGKKVGEAVKDDKDSADDDKSENPEVDMLTQAVQKAGEGPYQVAARLLKGKNDEAAQMALTKILKQQLMEDTGAKTYEEAVSKLIVGHKFFTPETIDCIREKVGASGNATLIAMFGPSVSEKAAADLQKEMGLDKD